MCLYEWPPSFQAQCGGEAVVLADGKVLTCFDLAGGCQLVPELVSVHPLAVAPGYLDPFLLTGRHISASHDAVFCRHKGEGRAASGARRAYEGNLGMACGG